MPGDEHIYVKRQQCQQSNAGNMPNKIKIQSVHWDLTLRRP